MSFPKTLQQIEIMRQGGKIVSVVLKELQEISQVGVTGNKLDEEARRLIQKSGGRPAFLGYRGFPAAICLSLNNEVLHGIPFGKRLKMGDLVTIDVGVIFGGMYTDAAESFYVSGKEEDFNQGMEDFLSVGRLALKEASQKAVVDNRVGDISNCIQTIIEKNGFSVVKDYCGHGVGFSLHESPSIPCYGGAGQGARLKNGQTLAIEVMYVWGLADLFILSDGWTVVTKDKSLSAVFEQTILVGDTEPEILTL